MGQEPRLPGVQSSAEMGSLALRCHGVQNTGQLGLCPQSWPHSVVWGDARTGDTEAERGLACDAVKSAG